MEEIRRSTHKLEREMEQERAQQAATRVNKE